MRTSKLLWSISDHLIIIILHCNIIINKQIILFLIHRILRIWIQFYYHYFISHNLLLKLSRLHAQFSLQIGIRALTISTEIFFIMSTKFDIEKFDGKISFAIWRVQMQAVLTQNGLKKVLAGKLKKPESVTDEQ